MNFHFWVNFSSNFLFISQHFHKDTVGFMLSSQNVLAWWWYTLNFKYDIHKIKLKSAAQNLWPLDSSLLHWVATFVRKTCAFIIMSRVAPYVVHRKKTLNPLPFFLDTFEYLSVCIMQNPSRTTAQSGVLAGRSTWNYSVCIPHGSYLVPRAGLLAKNLTLPNVTKGKICIFSTLSESWSQFLIANASFLPVLLVNLALVLVFAS